MLAQWQKLIMAGILALALLIGVWLSSQGRYSMAVFAVVLTLSAHALFLALEFVLLYRVHGADPTPKASIRQLFIAWCSEVCTAPLVFCWRQPFCSQRWPDRLPAAPTAASNSAASPLAAGQRRGVLLIHGFVCNRGIWDDWLRRLYDLGHPVLAVNLEPVLASIDDYRQTIADAVESLHRATGLAPVAVAHSMGGLALRRWYAEQADANRLHHALTLGTPHHGTWLARWGLSKNTRQMQQGSAWLMRLEAMEKHGRAHRFTCFYSHCDNIVFPPAVATLAGADNRHLPGMAHVHMVQADEPWAELLRRLA